MAKKTSTIHLRIEPEIKADVERLLGRLGISTTDAINIFLNQVILTGGLPFPVKIPEPNKETLAALKEAEDIRKGLVTSKAKSVEDFARKMGT
jgi:DNA-damage-inducible protein J